MPHLKIHLPKMVQFSQCSQPSPSRIRVTAPMCSLSPTLYHTPLSLTASKSQADEGEAELFESYSALQQQRHVHSNSSTSSTVTHSTVTLLHKKYSILKKIAAHCVPLCKKQHILGNPFSSWRVEKQMSGKHAVAFYLRIFSYHIPAQKRVCYYKGRRQESKEWLTFTYLENWKCSTSFFV